MGRETQNRQDGRFHFHCTPFPARKGCRVMIRLSKLIAPALKGLAESGEIEFDSDFDWRLLLPGLADLVSELDEDKVDQLIVVLLSGMGVEYESPETGQRVMLGLEKTSNIDLVFSGEMLAMFRAAQYAIEVNFGNFFDALSASMPEKPADEGEPQNNSQS